MQAGNERITGVWEAISNPLSPQQAARKRGGRQGQRVVRKGPVCNEQVT